MPRTSNSSSSTRWPLFRRSTRFAAIGFERRDRRQQARACRMTRRSQPAHLGKVDRESGCGSSRGNQAGVCVGPPVKRRVFCCLSLACHANLSRRTGRPITGLLATLTCSCLLISRILISKRRTVGTRPIAVRSSQPATPSATAYRMRTMPIANGDWRRTCVKARGCSLKESASIP